MQADVAVGGFFAALQQQAVAALHRQRGDLRKRVGPALENYWRTCTLHCMKWSGPRRTPIGTVSCWSWRPSARVVRRRTLPMGSTSAAIARIPVANTSIFAAESFNLDCSAWSMPASLAI